MSNFDQIVAKGLDARRGSWRDIAKQSGVSYSWLSKFANGRIPNPGYATLCKLHVALDKASRKSPPVTSNASEAA